MCDGLRPRRGRRSLFCVAHGRLWCGICVPTCGWPGMAVAPAQPRSATQPFFYPWRCWVCSPWPHCLMPSSSLGRIVDWPCVACLGGGQRLEGAVRSLLSKNVIGIFYFVLPIFCGLVAHSPFFPSLRPPFACRPLWYPPMVGPAGRHQLWRLGGHPRGLRRHPSAAAADHRQHLWRPHRGQPRD